MTTAVRTTPEPYRLSHWRRALNAVVRPLARLGLTGPRTHLLTVPGRRSGKPWSTPVSIVREGVLVVEIGTILQLRNAGDEDVVLLIYGAPPVTGNAEFFPDVP